jgi:hypothetical protein
MSQSVSSTVTSLTRKEQLLCFHLRLPATAISKRFFYFQGYRTINGEQVNLHLSPYPSYIYVLALHGPLPAFHVTFIFNYSLFYPELASVLSLLAEQLRVFRYVKIVQKWFHFDNESNAESSGNQLQHRKLITTVIPRRNQSNLSRSNLVPEYSLPYYLSHFPTSFHQTSNNIAFLFLGPQGKVNSQRILGKSIFLVT